MFSVPMFIMRSSYYAALLVLSVRLSVCQVVCPELAPNSDLFIYLFIYLFADNNNHAVAHNNSE